jgi:hypothetical protein
MSMIKKKDSETMEKARAGRWSRMVEKMRRKDRRAGDGQRTTLRKCEAIRIGDEVDSQRIDGI